MYFIYKLRVQTCQWPITIGIVFIHPGSIGLKLDYSDLFISDFHLADLLIGRAGKQKN